MTLQPEDFGQLRRRLEEISEAAAKGETPFNPLLPEQRKRITTPEQFETYLHALESAIKQDMNAGQSIERGTSIIASLGEWRSAVVMMKGTPESILPQILNTVFVQLAKLAINNPALQEYLQDNDIFSRASSGVAAIESRDSIDLTKQRSRIQDPGQFEEYIRRLEVEIDEDMTSGKQVVDGGFIMQALRELRETANLAKGTSSSIVPQVLSVLFAELEKIALNNLALQEYLQNGKILSRALNKVENARRETGGNTVINTGGEDYVGGVGVEGDQYNTGVKFPPGFPFNKTAGNRPGKVVFPPGFPFHNTGGPSNFQATTGRVNFNVGGDGIVSHGDMRKWTDENGDEITEYIDGEGRTRRRTRYFDRQPTTDVVVSSSGGADNYDPDLEEDQAPIDLARQKEKITTISQIVAYFKELAKNIKDSHERQAEETTAALMFANKFAIRAQGFNEHEAEIMGLMFGKLVEIATQYPELKRYLRKGAIIRSALENASGGRINTGGGAHVAGDINISGDFVGRKKNGGYIDEDGDYVGGIKTYGDQINGDSINTYGKGAVHIENSNVQGNVINGKIYNGRDISAYPTSDGGRVVEWTDGQNRRWREKFTSSGQTTVVRLW